jgi:hypothetical protein
MKPFALLLILALSTSGCMFSKSARMERAYFKQIKDVRVAQEKRRQRVIQRQRADMISSLNLPPREQPTVQQTAEPALESR